MRATSSHFAISPARHHRPVSVHKSVGQLQTTFNTDTSNSSNSSSNSNSNTTTTNTAKDGSLPCSACFGPSLLVAFAYRGD
jgi:hypothetical protein